MKRILNRTALLLLITAGHAAIILSPKPQAAIVQAPRPIALVTLPTPAPTQAIKPAARQKQQTSPVIQKVVRQQSVPTPPRRPTPSSQAMPVASPQPSQASNHHVPAHHAQAATESPRAEESQPAPAPVQPPTHIGGHLGNPRPVYPPLSIELEESGSVGLRVAVSAEGKAQSVDITRSSGFPRLDRSALQAVRNWRFRPAMRGTEAIPYSYTFSVEFDLTKKA